MNDGLDNSICVAWENRKKTSLKGLVYMKNNKLACLVDQAVVMVAIIVCFMLAAIYRYVLLGKNVPRAVFFWLVPMIILMLAWSIIKILSIKRISWDRKIILEVLLFALVVLLRIPLFHYIQKYDGGIYWGDIYKGAKDFEFSLIYIWENFKIWGHPTIMFAFFSMIGEFFSLGNSIGYCVINTIMSAFAVVCVYRICLDNLGIDKKVAFSICITLQCVPIFWGTFSHVNPDYMLFIFFVYMWYSHINQKYVLCFFWMFCMLQTKETGSILLFGYAFSYIIIALFHKESVKSIVKSVVFDPFFLVCILVALAEIIIFMAQGDVLTWEVPDKGSHKWIVGYSEVLQKGTDVTAFGFYPKYIICKLIHMFGLNYNWIASLIVTISFFYMYKHHLLSTYDWNALCPLIGTMIVYALFNCTYITFALYRYNVFWVVTFWFISLIFLAVVVKKKRMLIICNAIIMLILSIQTFYNTDVVSDFMFNRYPTGKGYIVASEMKKGILGDNIINNYTYSYIDELIDEMMIKVNYSEEYMIVYADEDVINRADVMALDTLKGNHLYAAWDKNNQKRVIYNDSNIDTYRIDAISYSEMLNIEQSDKKAYLLYYFDFSNMNSEKVKEDISNDYNVALEETLENWGGKLHYMLLTSK